ncbi:MAG TPA: tRNA epoxyqueuosine(34) reductase QueG [Bacteroidales bacterium]|nr:tRNA epoxyqueuosine(34) reductase QueG [Bacteroidales bacterium]
MYELDHIETLTNEIRDEAQRLGFAACGFAAVRSLEELKPKYEQWIDNGYHASMAYMDRNVDKRLDPALLVEGTKTVISLLYNYYTSDQLSQTTYKISRYAYGTDYHEVIKDKLNALDAFIRSRAENVIQRSFVDSAPVLERAWAQESGLGWIGKNTCLISRRHGSFLFISEIITSLELSYDEPLKDYCGSCRKCIDACPTQAIVDGRLIDSNKCISYQTIENRGEIPDQLAGKFSNYVFGCDICQEVCPWNTKAHHHNEPLFHLRDEIRDLTPEQWQNMKEEDYQRIFRKSAIKRSKFSGISRNVAFLRKDNNK